MPKISLKLNEKSIQEAIRQVEAYKANLQSKTMELQKKVVEGVADMVYDKFNGKVYDDILDEGLGVPDVNVWQDPEKGRVWVKGMEAVFVEFGAGVHHNRSTTYPLPRPPGISDIGKYGTGRGKQDIWVFTDASGQKHYTHGTPASMPMYLTAKYMATAIPDIARGVFADD